MSKWIQTAAVLTVLASSTAQAALLNYRCFSLDDNAPYGVASVGLRLEPLTGNARASFYSSERDWPWAVEKYTHLGRVTSHGKMRGRVVLGILNPQGKYSEGPIEQLFIEPALLEGGYRLRNGSKGGFLSMIGRGYSYAHFLCVDQKRR